jgi:hypothetical protein
LRRLHHRLLQATLLSRVLVQEQQQHLSGLPPYPLLILIYRRLLLSLSRLLYQWLRLCHRLLFHRPPSRR